VAREPQPQIDIHKAVSRLFCLFVCFWFLFFLSFDETTTELGLDAEELTESVLHLSLGYFLLCFVLFLFFPFDETMTELLLRHQHQDWRLKD
jgi:succinate-acetate transporter protein